MLGGALSTLELRGGGKRASGGASGRGGPPALGGGGGIPKKDKGGACFEKTEEISLHKMYYAHVDVTLRTVCTLKRTWWCRWW